MSLRECRDCVSVASYVDAEVKRGQRKARLFGVRYEVRAEAAVDVQRQLVLLSNGCHRLHGVNDALRKAGR